MNAPMLLNTEANRRPLTKLVYVLCAAIVIQTSMLSIYDRLITSSDIVHQHFAQWEKLVKDYYCVSIILTVLITIGAILVFYYSRGKGVNWRGMVAANGNRQMRNLALGLGGGALAFVLSLPLLARGDPAAKLGARLLLQSIGLSWGSVLVLLAAVLLLPVTIEILVCSITFDTLTHFASVPAAVIASSLLFAFLWPMLNSTVAAILGAISALLYYRTRSLTAPIVACIVLTMSGVGFALFQTPR